MITNRQITLRITRDLVRLVKDNNTSIKRERKEIIKNTNEDLDRYYSSIY